MEVKSNVLASWNAEKYVNSRPDLDRQFYGSHGSEEELIWLGPQQCI